MDCLNRRNIRDNKEVKIHGKDCSCGCCYRSGCGNGHCEEPQVINQWKECLSAEASAEGILLNFPFF